MDHTVSHLPELFVGPHFADLPNLKINIRSKVSKLRSTQTSACVSKGIYM